MQTYSYSGDPKSSLKDAVRFYLSDTGPDKWLFSDEEIEYMLAAHGNIFNAAAELAIVQATKYTDMRDKTVGPLSIKYGEVSDRWIKLAESLRRRSGGSTGARPVVTQSRRAPHVRLGMHDAVPDRWGSYNNPEHFYGRNEWDY